VQDCAQEPTGCQQTQGGSAGLGRTQEVQLGRWSRSDELSRISFRRRAEWAFVTNGAEQAFTTHGVERAR
jgi:hypothetical protein